MQSTPKDIKYKLLFLPEPRREEVAKILFLFPPISDFLIKPKLNSNEKMLLKKNIWGLYADLRGSMREEEIQALLEFIENDATAGIYQGELEELERYGIALSSTVLRAYTSMPAGARIGTELAYFIHGIKDWQKLDEMRREIYTLDLIVYCSLNAGDGNMLSPSSVVSALSDYDLPQLEELKQELSALLAKARDEEERKKLSAAYIYDKRGIIYYDKLIKNSRFFVIDPSNKERWNAQSVPGYSTEEYFELSRQSSNDLLIHCSAHFDEILDDGFISSRLALKAREKARSGARIATPNVHFSVNHIYSVFDENQVGVCPPVVFVFAADALIENRYLAGMPDSNDFAITGLGDDYRDKSHEIPLNLGVVFVKDSYRDEFQNKISAKKLLIPRVQYFRDIYKEIAGLTGNKNGIWPVKVSAPLEKKEVRQTVGWVSDSSRTRYFQPVYGVRSNVLR